MKATEIKNGDLRCDLDLIDAVGILYYSIANIAALHLDDSCKLYPKWVAIFGLISCLLLAISLPLITVATGLGLLFIGFILRQIFQKLNLSK